MLPEHQLMEILDKVGVEPEEECAVIIGLGDTFGGAVEHELGIFVNSGRAFKIHFKFVSFRIIFSVTVSGRLEITGQNLSPSIEHGHSEVRPITPAYTSQT